MADDSVAEREATHSGIKWSRKFGPTEERDGAGSFQRFVFPVCVCSHFCYCWGPVLLTDLVGTTRPRGD